MFSDLLGYNMLKSWLVEILFFSRMRSSKCTSREIRSHPWKTSGSRQPSQDSRIHFKIFSLWNAQAFLKGDLQGYKPLACNLSASPSWKCLSLLFSLRHSSNVGTWWKGMVSIYLIICKSNIWLYLFMSALDIFWIGRNVLVESSFHDNFFS